MKRRFLALLAAVSLLTGLFAVFSPAASAEPNVTARITIQRIRALASAEEGLCGTVDWYVKVWINGHEYNNEDSPSQDALEGHSDISPDWEFSLSNIDVASLDQSSGVAKIPIRIEAYDEDDLFCFGDDQYDISPTASKAIEGWVAVAPCNVFAEGDIMMNCGSSVIRAGTDSDRAELTFKAEVDAPASAPGLRIKCMHTPVWPQPGQPVTINATALDGALAPTVIADRLEIWVGSGPVKTVSGAGSTAYTFTPPAGAKDFSYGCRLTRGGTTIFSGWHRVTVGDPSPNASFPKPAIPILYTGPRSSRIDIVFIADRDTYANGGDPNFLADVAQVINTSYYGLNEFLAAQDKFNFWLLPDNLGRADDAADGSCDHDLPVLWDDVYAFADAGAILHRKNQRDCALRGDRIFSGVVNTAVRSDAFQVITHETGHQPFGLADEYCCDGGYFQQDVAPNVYEELDGCAADAPALGRTGSACREWERPTDWWPDPDWSTSEPDNTTAGAANDDLMNDNGPANAADIRRFNLIFGDCEAAKC
jgi:hypothetical protein